jgi:hypothetical protein
MKSMRVTASEFQKEYGRYASLARRQGHPCGAAQANNMEYFLKQRLVTTIWLPSRPIIYNHKSIA